eukprot:13079078-Alexandrium_andersonii.AAC.1
MAAAVGQPVRPAIPGEAHGSARALTSGDQPNALDHDRPRTREYPPRTSVVELGDAVSDFRGLAAEVEARAEAARLRTLGE